MKIAATFSAMMTNAFATGAHIAVDCDVAITSNKHVLLKCYLSSHILMRKWSKVVEN